MSKKTSAKPARIKHHALRPYSSILVDGPDRAPSRAMLYPVGFKPEDFLKPIIGIASTWGTVTPCNMHIDQLALESEQGANDAGGKAAAKCHLRLDLHSFLPRFALLDTAGDHDAKRAREVCAGVRAGGDRVV